MRAAGGIAIKPISSPKITYFCLSPSVAERTSGIIPSEAPIIDATMRPLKSPASRRRQISKARGAPPESLGRIAATKREGSAPIDSRAGETRGHKIRATTGEIVIIPIIIIASGPRV